MIKFLKNFEFIFLNADLNIFILKKLITILL